MEYNRGMEFNLQNGMQFAEWNTNEECNVIEEWNSFLYPILGVTDRIQLSTNLVSCSVELVMFKDLFKYVTTKKKKNDLFANE